MNTDASLDSSRTRTGRVELAGLVAALSLAALLAVVFFGWWPARVRSAESEAPRGLPLPVGSDTSALAGGFDALNQRLAVIERALEVRASSGTRADVQDPACSPASTSSEPPVFAPAPGSELAELHADLQQLSKRVDLLAGSLKEGQKLAFSLPTLEQVHAARRDVDWVFVETTRQLCLSDRDAARARVRFLTFDDVLRKIGLPNSIAVDDGRWTYAKTRIGDGGQPIQMGIQLVFVGDTVSSVTSFP